MSQFPALISGSAGKLTYTHVNRVFAMLLDHERRLRELGAAPSAIPNIPGMVIAEGLDAMQITSMLRALSWEERFIVDDVLAPRDDTGSPIGSEVDRDPFAIYAMTLHGPFGVMHQMYDNEGNERYLFNRAATLVDGKITAVQVSGSNYTYDAEADGDKCFRVQAATPINRRVPLAQVVSLTNPAAVNADCQLQIKADGTVKLLVWESFKITDCVRAAAATVAGPSFQPSSLRMQAMLA